MNFVGAHFLSWLLLVSTVALANDDLRECESVTQLPVVGLSQLAESESRLPNFSLGSQGYHSTPFKLRFDLKSRDEFFAQFPDSVLQRLLDPKPYVSSKGSLHFLSRYDPFSSLEGLMSFAASFDRDGHLRALRHIAYYPPPDFGVLLNCFKHLSHSWDLNQVRVNFFDFSPQGEMRSLGNLGHRYWKGRTHEIVLRGVPDVRPSARTVLEANPLGRKDCPHRDLMSDPNGLHVQMDQYMVLDLAEAKLTELSPRSLSTFGCATCLGVGLATRGRALVAHLVFPNGSAKSLLSYWLKKYFAEFKGAERPTLRLVGDGFASYYGIGSQMLGAASELGIKVEEVDIGSFVSRGLGYVFDDETRSFVPFRCDK